MLMGTIPAAGSGSGSSHVTHLSQLDREWQVERIRSQQHRQVPEPSEWVVSLADLHHPDACSSSPWTRPGAGRNREPSHGHWSLSSRQRQWYLEGGSDSCSCVCIPCTSEIRKPHLKPLPEGPA